MTTQQAIHYHPSTRQLACSGDWDLANLPVLQAIFKKEKLPLSGTITIDGSAIKKMDSAGAWYIAQLQTQLKQKSIKVELSGFSQQALTLLDIVTKKISEKPSRTSQQKLGFLANLGMRTVRQLSELRKYLDFVGQLTDETMRLMRHISHWRWNSLASVIYQTGYQGLPIIALLSFLIGVVLTYQMGLQLRNYGADIYIVDLLGLSVLREFAPLITAIMVAGRTGSAFTATLGMMKLNQEIDALDTLGVTPAELLLLPRIIGLFITLPLLTMWADAFGVLGGMAMSNNMLGISWYDFLQRFPHVIPLRSFVIGIGKAPVFALLIASIGCFQGMQVKNSADSVGQNTTRSVVLAIFFIIVADAIFSIIFSKMKL